mgnify:CR=1 FL=1
MIRFKGCGSTTLIFPNAGQVPVNSTIFILSIATEGSVPAPSSSFTHLNPIWKLVIPFKASGIGQLY